MNTLKINQKLITHEVPYYRAKESWWAYELRLQEHHGFAKHRLVGRIGKGTKLHKLIVLCRKTPQGLQIASIYSKCGSGVWSAFRNPSGFTLTDETECNCTKCNR